MLRQCSFELKKLALTAVAFGGGMLVAQSTVYASPTDKVPPPGGAPVASPTPAAATKDVAKDKDAGAEKAEKKKDEVVKTGVVASSSRIGNHASVNVQTSGDAPGDETSVIAGSISHSGRDVCIARIVNNGEKEYSVSFSVEGRDERGSKVFDRYFSGTVKAKSTFERQVSGCDPKLNMAVNLKSAKALGK